jgi:FtsH-binding integral membrane protein
MGNVHSDQCLHFRGYGCFHSRIRFQHPLYSKEIRYIQLTKIVALNKNITRYSADRPLFVVCAIVGLVGYLLATDFQSMTNDSCLQYSCSDATNCNTSFHQVDFVSKSLQLLFYFAFAFALGLPSFSLFSLFLSFPPPPSLFLLPFCHV